MARLEVKHFHQPEDLYCTPTCLKMCLDAVCKKHKIKGLKVFTLSKIAKITKTTPIDGTPPRAVEFMNSHLLKARPSLKFIYHEGSKFPEIEKELNKKQLPVIVFLNPKEKPPKGTTKFMHAVVIVEYDSVNRIVYFDDPLEDKEETAIQSLDVGTFVRRWEWETKWVQILLGKDQTYISGYLEQGGPEIE
ncbi:MAG: C39 family peptidase [Candidatus Bathyarchaeota archaeon]|nr:C39 family peptidase [Candidatus Bathyarchaeota archaeon]